MFSRIRWFTRYEGRKLEYATSAHMVGFGAFLLAPTESMLGSLGIEASARLLLEQEWGALFFFLGAACLVALHVNGRGWWTPFARMSCFGAAMVAHVAISSGFVTYQPSNPATFVFLSLAFLFCGEGFLVASRDAGREISRWRRGRLR